MRKIQSFGLSDSYRSRYKSYLKSLRSLVFVPVRDISAAVGIILNMRPKSTEPDFAQLVKFEVYFFRTWVVDSSLFPLELWNQYGVLTGRTTNICEGWHHRLQKRISRPKPTVFELLNCFKCEHFAYSRPITMPKYKKNQSLIDLFSGYADGSMSLELYTAQ